MIKFRFSIALAGILIAGWSTTPAIAQAKGLVVHFTINCRVRNHVFCGAEGVSRPTPTRASLAWHPTASGMLAKRRDRISS